MAVGNNAKAKISPFIYVAGCALSLWLPALGVAAYAVVAGIWLVPDRRLERAFARETERTG